jgi:hypothetical protein
VCLSGRGWEFIQALLYHLDVTLLDFHKISLIERKFSMVARALREKKIISYV